jgi:sulfopyruvate decarboxylase subunit alpha
MGLHPGSSVSVANRSVADRASPADEVAAELAGAGFGPFFGTPCGILAPLYAALEDQVGLLTITREDNAIGVAAGTALAGRYPVVAMQNSGLGQSVNAIASLVIPYKIAVLLVVGMRGVHPDRTQENVVMGSLTERLLSGLGVPAVTLEPGPGHARQIQQLRDHVQQEHRCAALLIPPTAFGWAA